MHSVSWRRLPPGAEGSVRTQAANRRGRTKDSDLCVLQRVPKWRKASPHSAHSKLPLP